jgi:hypothetical protein
MQNDNIDELLRKIAQNEGLDKKEIRNEISLAISFALKSKDPALQNFWENIPSPNGTPTVDEIVDYLIVKMAEQEN